MTYTADFLDKLQTELLRVTAAGGYYNKFKDEAGKDIEGATETDVIKHLTSAHDFQKGRQYRFPGIGNGWEFSSALKAAGFQIVRARNYRNQPCNIVTL